MMAGISTSSFIMHGAREALASGLTHIEQQVTSIERAVVENPGLAFDLSKTLVESVCRTVLSERAISYADDDDLPKLFKMVSQFLPFLPETASGESETRQSLNRTLNGLSTAILGICQLRNQCGFASHGSGSPRPPLESAQALMVAEAADTIIGFLHRVHRQDRVKLNSLRNCYEENHGFNDSIDESYGMIHIFDIEFRPSEVLFQMEPESYRVYLAEFGSEVDVVECTDQDIGPEEVAP